MVIVCNNYVLGSHFESFISIRNVNIDPEIDAGIVYVDVICLMGYGLNGLTT